MAKQSTKKTDYVNELKKNPVLESANLHTTGDDTITLIREYKFLQGSIGIVYNRRTDFLKKSLKADTEFFVKCVTAVDQKCKELNTEIRLLNIEDMFK